MSTACVSDVALAIVAPSLESPAEEVVELSVRQARPHKPDIPNAMATRLPAARTMLALSRGAPAKTGARARARREPERGLGASDATVLGPSPARHGLSRLCLSPWFTGRVQTGRRQAPVGKR
jgi:hypothetical protein